MAIQGTVPLYRFQMGWELPTRGEAHAATNALPIIGGELQDHHELSQRMEQRNSYIAFHRAPIQTKNWGEISGLEVVPTFEELPAYFGVALKKVQDATGPTATSVYSWVYSTTAASDDLATATLEVGDDATDFVMSMGVINRLQFGWEIGGPATMTMDWLGRQMAVASTYSSGLTFLTSEEINPAEAIVYIDDTTIGTTQSTAVQSLQFTIDNHYIQHWAADGNYFPNDVYRSEPRSLSLEMTIDFDSTTEYIAYASTVERKVRCYIPGSAIAGSSPATPKSLTIDAYVYNDDAPFSTADGRRQMRMTGQSVYNTGAGHDWQVTVANANSHQD
jgi:hypothetical protein